MIIHHDQCHKDVMEVSEAIGVSSTFSFRWFRLSGAL